MSPSPEESNINISPAFSQEVKKEPVAEPAPIPVYPLPAPVAPSCEDDGKIQKFMREWFGKNWRAMVSNWKASFTGVAGVALWVISQNVEVLNYFIASPELRHAIWLVAVNGAPILMGTAFAFSRSIGGSGVKPPPLDQSTQNSQKPS